MVATQTAGAQAESVLGDIEAGEAPMDAKAAARHALMRCDEATIYRLFTRGRGGITLEFAQLRWGRATTESAIRRFVARLTAAAHGEPHGPSTRSPRRRQSALAATRARLQRSGI